jgi:hypothetical protein
VAQSQTRTTYKGQPRLGERATKTEKEASIDSSNVDSSAPWPSPGRGWYVIIVLLIGFTFSFIDRQILNLLVAPVLADLGISDTEISFCRDWPLC